MDRITPLLKRGVVWYAQFDPVRGREQAGHRPALIVSTDRFNGGPSDLVVVLPITSHDRQIRWHVPLIPPDGGLTRPSLVMCEQPHVLAIERLDHRSGAVDWTTMTEVVDRLRLLLDL